MSNDAKAAIRDSAQDFVTYVWPIVGDWIGNGTIIPVETVTDDDFKKKLDVLAGIDSWQVIDGTGIRGIASRVQWPTNPITGEPTYIPWESFTIRESLASGGRTELSKKSEAIEGGFLYPQYTIQAYLGVMHKGPILYICMMDTPSLFDYVKKYPQELQHKLNPKEGNGFVAAYVRNIRQRGYIVQEHKPAIYTGDLFPSYETDIA